MKKKCATVGWRTVIAVAAFSALLNLPAAAQSISESFQLQPGWNAVYLEIEPDTDITNVFQGIPLLSAWTFDGKLSSVDFIQNQNEVPWNQAGWLRYLPPSQEASMFNTLFKLRPNRAYLLKLGGGSPVTLTITGRPTLRETEWVPDSYNLRGFPLQTNASPTFGTFLQSAPALNTVSNGLLKVYRLSSLGQWSQVRPTDTMRSGEAYWIYCTGACSFVAPLTVSLHLGGGLDFGAELNSLPILLKPAAGATNFTIRNLFPTDAFGYSRFDATNGLVWQTLPTTLSSNQNAGAFLEFVTEVRRSALTTASHTTVLEITDNLGTRYWVPVSVDVSRTGTTRYAGLWSGTATITAVSEVNSGLLQTNAETGAVIRTGYDSTPRPVKNEFDLRLLIHVDTNGQARLLKEVIQMWQNGTTTNDAQGYVRVATPGRYVLVTKEHLISQFQGASMRDGVPVGKRLSSAGIDFDGGLNNYLDLTGMFSTNGTLTGTIQIDSTMPTNPFRHKYHPDHKNIEDIMPITRELTLQFSVPTNGVTTASTRDYGYESIGGSYRETVSGLHKNQIVASGTFQLKRITDIGVLNQ